MSEESTLLEVQDELQKLMSDLESRMLKVYDTYTDDKQIPQLPSFKELKNPEVNYNCSKKILKTIDVLNEMKLRVSMLYRYMVKYQNFQPASKTEYVIVQSFKNSLKNNIEVLSGYRSDLQDLIRNATNKVRLLDSARFADFS